MPSFPRGVLLSRAGVILMRDARIEAPTSNIFSPDFGNEFTIIVSLRSQRANNAFLFSVKNKKNRLQFGIQLLPKKIVVYIAEKKSVYFSYSVHNGQWHSFAIGVSERSVSFYAECGGKHVSKETLTNPQKLGSDGSLTLGRMNLKAVQFEGVLCQLDIYPSAQASANYCNYVKKQCRLADTYRSAPPLVNEASSGYLGLTPKSMDSQYSDGSPVNITEQHTVTKPSSNPVTNNIATVTSLNQHSSLKPTLRQDAKNHSAQGITERVPLLHSNTVETDSSPVLDSVTQQTEVGVKLRKGTSARRGAGPQESQSEKASKDANRTKMQPKQDKSPPLISPVKQSKIKESLQDESRLRQSMDNVMEVQLKINRTLYRSPEQMSANNQVDPWEEAPYTDASFNTETAYDVDMENYDYSYGDLDYSVDYDGLPGPKGDPGPPVSVNIINVFNNFAFDIYAIQHAKSVTGVHHRHSVHVYRCYRTECLFSMRVWQKHNTNKTTRFA
ncbi:UNVERIFIED_CONTAM: hypothetical protein FKN15_062521 [Acipenser sinensis]